jgi:hypothetical protein
MNINIEKLEVGYLLTIHGDGYDKSRKVFCATRKDILLAIEAKLYRL